MALRILLFLLIALPAFGANLVPNSSFEVGAGRGWLTFGTANSAYLGEVGPTKSFLTNSAAHGTWSMIIVPGARLQSRAMWLKAGTYTMTLKAKTFSGLQGPYHGGIMDGGNLSEVSPPSLGNITGSFLSYTQSFTASSNAFYWVKFLNNGQPTFCVDAIQVEAGSATTYAPASTVEMGIIVDGTNNMYFSGDTPTFTVKAWNEGAATAERWGYQIFDLWNSNIITAHKTISIGSGDSAMQTIQLPSRNGLLRLTTRLYSYNDSYDECSIVIYPYASNVVSDASNDWLGGHVNASDFHTRREQLTNRKWTRLLSPNFRNTRWWNPSPNTAESVEATRGSFSFVDSLITGPAALGIQFVGPLTPADGYWAQWATNANGTWDAMAWSNYCYVVVNRFKNYIHAWEIGPNEPYQSGPYTNLTGTPFGTESLEGQPFTGTNLPINVRVATNYSLTLSYGIAGVTNADPTATIIGVAGAYGAGEWAWTAWTNLSSDIQSWVDIISTHIYPQEQGQDPNEPEHAAGHFSNPDGWIRTFGGIREVWNTESGTYSSAGSTIKGLNGMFPISYDVQRTLDPTAEAIRSASMVRQLAASSEILSEALRCIGLGFRKYFYYDSRAWNDASYVGLTSYASDYQYVDRAEIVPLSVARQAVQWGFGYVTNAVTFYLEMYAFTNAQGMPVITAWNAARTNILLTCSNSFFEVRDAMWNLVQTNVSTIVITRIPQYIRSGTLSLTQLSNTLCFATGSASPDIQPPQVSFDIAPSGPWSGDTNRTLIKWTGIDNVYTAWATNGVVAPSATNVVFQWALDGASYNSPSQSNHVWLSHLSAGNHIFRVRATDKAGNSADYVHYFVPPPSVLNVSGTARIGTITIAP